LKQQADALAGRSVKLDYPDDHNFTSLSSPVERRIMGQGQGATSPLEGGGGGGGSSSSSSSSSRGSSSGGGNQTAGAADGCSRENAYETEPVHILSVDDEPVNQQVMMSVLRGAGYSDVTVAMDGQQALDEVMRRMVRRHAWRVLMHSTWFLWFVKFSLFLVVS
jgi:hypothetical protein